MSYTIGLLKATKGPFAGCVFYPDPVADVINRVQFRINTWHGTESTDDWEQGGWWHLNSITWDSSGVTLHTEVTYDGSAEEGTIPWGELDEDSQCERREELYEEATAWKWVSGQVSTTLGLEALTGKERQLASVFFAEQVEKVGFGEAI